MIVGAIAAFNEEERIGGAVESLLNIGCQRVLVLDGAWLDGEGVPFGQESYFSNDLTCEVAREAGAEVQQWAGGDDAAKQTQLIHRAGRMGATYIFRMDADEIARGYLPEITGHSMVWLHNHGANDIPDVRSTWPRGDDSAMPIPLFRVYKYQPDLVCVRPGRWVTDHGALEPYITGQLAHLIDTVNLPFRHPLSRFYRDWREEEGRMAPELTAAFPILNYVDIDHFRDDRNAVAKRAYYEAVA